MGINSNVDILKKVADIERLKCGLLEDVSAFFTASANGGSGAESLCKILTNCYLLALNHGISLESIDKRTADMLKQEILNNPAETNKQNLLKHIGRRIT